MPAFQSPLTESVAQISLSNWDELMDETCNILAGICEHEIQAQGRYTEDELSLMFTRDEEHSTLSKEQIAAFKATPLYVAYGELHELLHAIAIAENLQELDTLFVHLDTWFQQHLEKRLLDHGMRIRRELHQFQLDQEQFAEKLHEILATDENQEEQESAAAIVEWVTGVDTAKDSRKREATIIPFPPKGKK